MPAEFLMKRKLFAALFLWAIIASAIPSSALRPMLRFVAHPVYAAPQAMSSTQAQDLVRQALAAELEAAQDSTHPMRYQLRKSNPRFTSTKQIVETRDGAVARLISIDDKPLNAADEQQEQARLDQFLADPGRQHHRKQSEDEDTGRALKVLHALPAAFLYEDAGPADAPPGAPSQISTGTSSPSRVQSSTPSGTPSHQVEKFNFHPNPAFSPPDLETQILTQMTGSLWIDPAQKRVVRLEGHLDQDVDFGWGILGRLDKGGWIALDQADVGGGQWRLVRFQMVMSGRVVFKTRHFDTTEEETHFTPVPSTLDYRQAIEILRSNP